MSNVLGRTVFYPCYPELGSFLLHIPRTAGTWLTGAFNICEVHCSPYIKLKTFHFFRRHALLGHMDGKTMGDFYFIFSIVRHPVDYYEAIWRLMGNSIAKYNRHPKENWSSVDWDSITEARRWYCPDFVEWVELMLENQPGWVTRLYEQFVGPENAEFCQFIGRTETIFDDFCLLMDLFGYEDRLIEYSNALQDLSKARPGCVREKRVKRVEWPKELRSRVEYIERLGINRFYGKDTINKRYYGYLGAKPEGTIFKKHSGRIKELVYRLNRRRQM